MLGVNHIDRVLKIEVRRRIKLQDILQDVVMTDEIKRQSDNPMQASTLSAVGWVDE